ncbi:MAG: nucleoside triphosphate pyrophosphohydrolase [Candidatus Margulisbacteria bacterium]|nr:nucleoside triphosphate pyrophosphohydrolase [Candidatus Margulisiibacteriota bacterium]
MHDYLLKYQELTDIVKKLLSPEGCPWDREQTHETLKNYLIEEAYEFVEAVEENDYLKMEEELGDLLFHVVIHSVIAEQNNKFSLQSVAEKISQKMIRRHPHVFGDGKVSSVDEVWKNWDSIKRKEKKEKSDNNKAESMLHNVPKNLPALLRAEKIQKRVARVGFDWADVSKVWNKVHEELQELKDAVKEDSKEHIREEVGDLLFSVVNLCRKLDIDPEDALQHSNKKFISRFSYLENKFIEKKKDISESSLEEMDFLWNEAKRAKQ